MKSATINRLVLGISAAALAVLVTMPVASLQGQWNRLWPLAALALIAGTRTVRLPSLGVHATTTHPLVLIAIAALGPAAAVLTGLAGVLGDAIGRRWPKMLHLGFNSGMIVLSTAVSSWVFALAGGRPGLPLIATIWPLCAANIAFFVVNAGLVSLVVSLDKRCGLVVAWRRSVAWSLVSYTAGFSFAAGVVGLFDVAVLWALAVAVPPCWLLIVFYRMVSEQCNPSGATTP